MRAEIKYYTFLQCFKFFFAILCDSHNDLGIDKEDIVAGKKKSFVDIFT